MKDLSFLYNAHPSYIENLYLEYQKNPESLEEGWQTFFQGFNLGKHSNGESKKDMDDDGSNPKEFAVLQLIEAYRHRGHLLSETNPIRKRKDRKPYLDINDFGLNSEDLLQKFQVSKILGLDQASLDDILQKLHQIYCGHIGFEFAHIEDHDRRNWLLNKIEGRPLRSDYGLSMEKKKRIFDRLNGAVIFEKFLHTKYVGQKRFSLEGGESTIAALDAILELAVNWSVEEVIIGMAHRGRLNVLANIIGKTYEQIFNEFEGNAIPDLSFGSGDVKYHLGFSSQVQTQSGKILQIKLAPNPSHLEAIDSIVEGMARAKADILYQSDYDKILPILIHGDAALAGQGVVFEILQMSALEGYYTGGTIHFVINNQIGFTTDFDDARSSTYSTGVAAVVQAPVFHVNGDDPEAVVFAVELALEYRQEFNSDVFIDMVCYRRHGHNEGDDPKFTQPAMYEIISKHPNVREIYFKILTERGDVETKIALELEQSFWNILQERLDMVKQKPLPYTYQKPELAWRNLKKKAAPNDFVSSPNTGIEPKKMKQMLTALLTAPKEFHALPKVNRLLKSWKDLVDQNKLDWSLAELLSYASILADGKNVRMSGQDVKRGTFSHRHAILYDEENNQEYNRLSTISKNQGTFFIYNSLLSEFAVLGFEYGYSLVSPEQLVIWEAQFGDFANGAQVVFDQFIASAENKWNRMSGLVVLLPHGYDGQGPEHSSARLERFLQACAEYNMIITNVTTPANFFHLMRRQVEWKFRKPLVVMSPKSLLRHPKCVSPLDDFTITKHFIEVIEDVVTDPKKVKKVILCSGQIYYDLIKKRDDISALETAILRIEQLYPFPEVQLKKILSQYNNVPIFWVQEEPENMGASSFIRTTWSFGELQFITRPASASTAVGFKKTHDQQLHELLEKAFIK
ncbi:MAG: 2-oxoglutarate dehydrogenase E1 component [Bacteroidota bacterium]|nr:2-oxoglutarate dehydrogenase E1 component [Bacteroidota bacterium]